MYSIRSETCYPTATMTILLASRRYFSWYAKSSTTCSVLTAALCYFSLVFEAMTDIGDLAACKALLWPQAMKSHRLLSRCFYRANLSHPASDFFFRSGSRRAVSQGPATHSDLLQLLLICSCHSCLLDLVLDCETDTNEESASRSDLEPADAEN